MLTHEEIDRTTGPDGVADFGLVRPGNWEFLVKAEWDEEGRSLAHER